MVLIGLATENGTKYGSLNQDYVNVSVLSKRISDENGEEQDSKMEADALSATLDDHCHSSLSGDRIIIASVMDGHGMLGEMAARAAAKSLHEYIEDSLRERVLRKSKYCSLREFGKSRIKDMVQRAFAKAHEDVLELYKAAPPSYTYPYGGLEEVTFTLESKPLIRGDKDRRMYNHPMMGPRLLEFGSTASIVILDGDFAAIAHVGDSRVCMGKIEGEYVEGVQLTPDHSGFNASERFRILEVLSEDDKLLECANIRGTHIQVDDIIDHINHLKYD